MSQGFTTIAYGNVAIYRCTTRSFVQEEVLDDSGTNLRMMRFTITVHGYMNGHLAGTQVNTSPNNPPTGTGLYQYNLTADSTGIDPFGNASVRHQQMRRQLPPRQTFVMRVGDVRGDGSSGQNLIVCSPAPLNMNPPSIDPKTRMPVAGTINLSGIDMSNGPHCLNLTVSQITGDELYECEATFQFTKVECDRDLNVPYNTYGILSNRWSCIDSYDANLRDVRTYNGTVCLASQNINPQQLRWLVLPPIVQMFRRDDMRIEASMDGLTINWSVTDTEVAMSAPYPAKKWNVEHTIGAKNGMIGESSINIDLESDSNVNKADLIELAMYIMTAKLWGYRPNEIGNVPLQPQEFWDSFFIDDLEFVDYIGDVNRLSLRARVHKTMTALQLKTAAADIAEQFGKPLSPPAVNVSAIGRDNRPQYDRAYSWGGYAGDSPPYTSPAASIVGIFVNYLQNPCNDFHSTFVTSGPPSNSPNTPIPVSNRASTDLNQKATPAQPVPYTAEITPYAGQQNTSNSYISVSQTKAAYTFWQIDNVYSTNSMRVAMPIASAASPTIVNNQQQNNYISTTSIVQLAAYQALRIMRVSAERIGQEPQFPNPELLNQQPSPGSVSPGNGPTPSGSYIIQTFLRSILKPGTVSIGVMGQQIYRADAEYHFALSRAPNPGEQLALGNDIWSFLGNQMTQANGNLTKSSWS